MRSTVYALLRKPYVQYIRPHVSDELNRQRIKLLWFIWGYWPLLYLNRLPFTERLKLIRRFLRIDWNVVHAHKPAEIVLICRVVAKHGRPQNGEIFIEAGCWQGGSSAKFSALCSILGYSLKIYDSFEGVEPLTDEEKKSGGYDYSGEYASTIGHVRRNLATYGIPNNCELIPGWFSDTLAHSPPVFPVRFAYIDCDTAKGTSEVLSGVIPSLTTDGVIFTQDYHIPSVKKLLENPETWEQLGKRLPIIEPQVYNIATIRFEDELD